MKKYSFFIIALVLLFVSCEKEETNNKPIASFEIIDKIDVIEIKSTSSDLDLDVLSYEWIIESDVEFSTRYKSAYFDITKLNEPVQLTVKLVVSDGLDSDAVTETVELPAYDKVRRLGLGRELEKEVSINRSYNWYIDQRTTGQYAKVNCGPSVTTMVAKWYDESFSFTVEDARNVYPNDGDWWFTNDITAYLNRYNIPNRYVSFKNKTEEEIYNLICTQLDLGNLLIFCVDMYYFSFQEKEEWHVDKFYRNNETGAGHFLIVKGYKKVDNAVFFEVYDSDSWGRKYNDGTFKGIDRYYKGKELKNSAEVWWNNAIVISDVKNKSVSISSVDPNSIQHNKGK